MNVKLPTEFAPAERAAPAALKLQATAVEQGFNAGLQPNAVPALLMILNAQRQIVYANQNVLKLLNLSDSDCLGFRPGEVFHCGHAMAAEHGCGTTAFCSTCGAVNAILTAQQGRPDVRECRIMAVDGEALDLRVWTTPMEINNEKYVIFAVLDISNEKRRRILERIFFHDIMNVASGLRGFSDLLEMGSPDDAKRFQGMIRTLAGDLIEEIQAQRDLVNAENDELSVKPEALNSRALLIEIAAQYKNMADAQGVVIVGADDAEELDLTSDKVLLRRVLGNIVKNAVEASVKGDVINIGCRADGESVEFRVHNPAVMPDDVKLQIFQRSFSTKGSGRGLGAYSVKLLTERYLKGTVAFISEEGQGTTFIARYPLRLTLSIIPK